MTDTWSPEDLQRIDAADELKIAVRRTDGTLRAGVPIWVVRVGPQVFVRSWHRRDTGWFGQVVNSGRARVSVPGLETDVVVEDVGPAPSGVDEAYRTKYARYGGSSVGAMIAPAAVATTLRLSPEHPGNH